MKQLQYIISVAVVIFVAGAAFAHEIWLEKREDKLVLLYGHTGITHDDRECVEYSPDQVLRVECFDERGDRVDVEFEHIYPVCIEARHAVTYVLTSSGYWAKTPFGTKNLPKDESKSPIHSWLSYESVKRIDAWNEKLAKPFTEELELAPINNPLRLSKGKKIRLLVTSGGKPLGGVPVSYNGKTRGVSDSNGRVNVRLKHSGMQLIQASFTEPGDSVKADEIVHSTTLVFEIEGDN